MKVFVFTLGLLAFVISSHGEEESLAENEAGPGNGTESVNLCGVIFNKEYNEAKKDFRQIDYRERTRICTRASTCNDQMTSELSRLMPRVAMSNPDLINPVSESISKQRSENEYHKTELAMARARI